MEMEQSYHHIPSGGGRNGRDHQLILKSRRLLDITGVKQVESFDSEEFLLETDMGFLSIRGHDLQMKNLDVEEGNVSIKGMIEDLVYLDQLHGEKTKGLFGKLFK
jgi:sporulation protein YabP